jgi:hypothetical protein
LFTIHGVNQWCHGCPWVPVFEPSQHSLDYNPGHSQEWKAKTCYQYIKDGDYEIERILMAPVGMKENIALPPHLYVTIPQETQNRKY